MTWSPLILTMLQLTTLLSLAIAISSALRRAAQRHMVLLAGLLATLAWPVLYGVSALFGYSLALPILPAPVAQQSQQRITQFAATTHATDTPQSSRNDTFRSDVDTGRDVGQATKSAHTSDNHVPHIEAATTTWSWHYLLYTVWGVGVLAGSYGLVRSHMRMTQLLKSIRPWGNNEYDLYRDAIEQAARYLNVPQFPRVGSSAAIAGPAVGGLLTPTVLIPIGLAESLDTSQFVQVLVHEGAHAARRDPLIMLAQRIVSIFYWWHPLVHLFGRKLDRTREEVCDDYVLQHVAPVSYGETLLRLATLPRPAHRIASMLGMFDANWRLEQRIAGLLDPERPTSSRISAKAAIGIIGCFTAISVALALGRLEAHTSSMSDDASPKESATKTSPAPEEAIDIGNFELVLSYVGEPNPSYLGVAFSTNTAAIKEHQPAIVAPLSEPEARRILSHLRATGYFDHAHISRDEQDPNAGSQYVLRVRIGERTYSESLGWNLGTILQLSALRHELEGESARAMDRLLGPLENQRTIWEQGNTTDGLRTTLSMDQKHFPSGAPIRLRLSVTNNSHDVKSYQQHDFILSGAEFLVFDAHGRVVPYLLGGAGLLNSASSIAPGETQVAEDCDLSDYYYLRKPGPYTVTFQGFGRDGLSQSNSLSFEVTGPLAQTDGDPLARLMPLYRAPWALTGSPNIRSAIQPGANRKECPGWYFLFFERDRGLKLSRGTISVWLTKTVADETEQQGDDHSMDSVSLGVVSDWHVYLHATAEAHTLWPTMHDDIKAALVKPPSSAVMNVRADASLLIGPKWGTVKDGLRTRLLTGTTTFRSGENIPLTLQVENTLSEPKEFVHREPLGRDEIIIYDSDHKQVPYIGAQSPVQELRRTAPSHLQHDVATVELTDLFYLRKPGKYIVSYAGEPSPSEITITIHDDIDVSQ